MRRVLVIQDVGLWIDLNRHLSGVASVDLVEAMSFETGQLLAQIERPRIVVCGPASGGPGPVALARELRAAGLDEIHVISIDPRAPATGPKRGAGSPLVCRPDRLVGLVTELLAEVKDEREPTVELLAHYELVGSPGEPGRRGFAVILELSDRHLMFESDTALRTGSELDLNFFLADEGSSAGRAKVALTCILSRCRDESKLIYSARVSKLTEVARTTVRRHAARGHGRGA